MQWARNFGVPIEVHQGLNCIKSKVYGQLGVQLKEIKSWRT
jgi:hypothetical protein